MERDIRNHIEALAAILDEQAAQLKEISDEKDIYHRMQLLFDFQRGGRVPSGAAGVGCPAPVR